MIKNRITIVGSGFVGMSLGVMLAQKNDVVILDIDKERVDKINKKINTISDKEIDSFLVEKDLSLSATTDKKSAFSSSEFIIIATPTDYDPQENYFNTESVDSCVAHAIEINQNALIVIKSTIPVGHTKKLQKKYKTDRIIFSPEFLREGNALKDNLFPSRIIVGGHHELCRKFVEILRDCSLKEDIETLFVGSEEAESIKLFANAYLAMRVSFFNELDSYALENNLNSRSIIDGVCLDRRIGKGYNNPSFGYGGYCLPKDTKQLLANFDKVPQNIIEAIILSNSTRKDFITKQILKYKPSVVGIYRLIMKEGSDNFRSSSIKGIISRVIDYDVEIIIYEPGIQDRSYQGISVVNDIEKFKVKSDIIVANRMSKSLLDVKMKCFTRDLFNEN